MAYEIKISDDSVRFLGKLDARLKDRVEELLEALKSNSLPFKQYDLRKLKGTANFFRIRIGKLRVIYEISGQTIYVHHVGFRESVYD